MGLLLKCEHVGFGYENQDAVLDVNLEVNEGDYTALSAKMVREKVP